GAAAKVGPSLDSAASWRIHRCGLPTNATGDISVTWVPNTATQTIISRPMSWYSGNQLTLRMSQSMPVEITICSTLVPIARWVISTPTGARVEPDVYCKYAMSSVSRRTGANVAPTESGISSIAITRGLRWRGSDRTNSCTAAPAAVVVSTTAGWASPSTVSRRSACPGNSGANNGTAMSPALIAAKKPTM